ncbi:MAG TPA: fasciclin domain-containing protein [Nocardioides sp.]|nr:fasciclin domain-containing protein [Nocardioides sp.]
MKIRSVTALAVLTLALGALAPAAADAPGPAAKPGERSLAKLLAGDGTKLDTNPFDFDITEKAVLTVLGAKPGSPVAVLTDGSQRLTAFVPTDQAFKYLVRSLKGFKPKSEAKTLKQVKRLGVDTIETVLLYHVVAGRTLVSEDVLAADGARLRTAQGGRIQVNVGHEVVLGDRDPDARDPRAIAGKLDLNRGNRQVAHGIDRVLRPLDL